MTPLYIHKAFLLQVVMKAALNSVMKKTVLVKCVTMTKSLKLNIIVIQTNTDRNDVNYNGISVCA